MAAFYLDHDVPALLAGELRRRGHDVRTARELRLERGRDDEQLLFAAQQAWILVSFNRKDYRLLHGAWRHWFAAYGITPAPQHAGILLLRQQVWSDAEAAEQLSAVIDTGTSLVNELFEWTPSRGWVRPT